MRVKCVFNRLFRQFNIINYLHNNVGKSQIGIIMDMFDIPTEKELLGQVKAHLETKKPVKTLDVDDVFPFWNAASVSTADTDSMRKPNKKGLVMPNDKVGCVKPLKTIKEWKAERIKGHKETTSEAQKEPEVKKTAQMEAAGGTPKFKPVDATIDTTYSVKGAPKVNGKSLVGSIKPIKAGETVSIEDMKKLIAAIRTNNLPNNVGIVKPQKKPTLNVGGRDDFGVVTSDKPMKNPNPKAYAKYVEKDMDGKKTEKLVELGKPEYKKEPPKTSKTDLVGVVKVKK